MSGAVLKSGGFTLIEMLVALFVFALISVAGVALLRGSADGQAVMASRLGDTRGLALLSSTLESDLIQAAPRRVRNRAGSDLPLFATGGRDGGTVPGELFAFVRAGAAPEPGQGTLQRVAYGLSDGALTRIATGALDGAAPRPAAPLLRRVGGVALRFRGEDGGWTGDWAPADPATMPRAIELTVRAAGQPPVTMLFAVGPQVRPPRRPATQAVPAGA